MLVLVLPVVLVLDSCSRLTTSPSVKDSFELPVGTTRLAELGCYQVVYQLYDRDRVEMPPGWSGHFTEDVGIAYYEHGVQNGRRAFVLHCPWKAGQGLVRLEYLLNLPKRPPITLRFGIAMRADITDKSDGVTFSAAIVADGKQTELMREHYTKAEWKDCAFDLSSYAGRSIRLTFQTEPGPKNDSSFDFSLLGDPTITVVRDEDPRPQLLRSIIESSAYRAAAHRDLTKLANDPAQGIVPSTAYPHETQACEDEVWTMFRYRGEDCVIEYSSRLRGPLDKGILAVLASADSIRPLVACSGSVQLAPNKEEPHRFADPERVTEVSRQLRDGRLTTVCRYELGDVRADVTWTFRLVGKALAITADSDSPHIARLSLGQPLSGGLRQAIRIPYLGGAHAYFLRPWNVFVMSYLDWTKSMASRTQGNVAIYLPQLDGTRNKLHEEGYVAISHELGEVLPNIPHPPSPSLKLLAPEIMLDIWGGTYDQGAELLRTLKSYGVDNAAVIWHNWQRYGYDVKLPDHLPANPAMGGDEAMKRLGAAAREVGYPFSLHENYIDFYPDAPSYDPKDVVLNEKGEFSKAWYHRGTKVQSFALKAGRMLHYAAQNSPEIHRRFGTTAAYLDVHTCVPPWHHVDYDPKTEFAGAHHLKVNVHKQLFQYERDTHGGPLFGEGHNHFYWAGLVDGVEAQVQGGEDCPLLLDFDLLKLHPQMVNHGMGYTTRWLRTGRQTKWGIEAPTPAQLDKYRAMTLAYGHAGFVGSETVYAPHLVWREHNIVSPVQALYGAAKASEILYEVDGNLVTSSAAAPVGALDRVRVTYDSGLVVHVNLREADWQVGEYVLPQYGFLAQGPNLLAYTAKRDGVIVDYAEDGETLFADARTHVYRPWEQRLVAIEPKLKDFRALDGGAFEITCEWAVEQELDQDYTAFVHFVNPDAEEGEEIAFQGDHPPNPPTSKWRKGTVVADGPHRVQVPADQAATTYDIVIGLYRRDAPRVALRGTDIGQHRILIGRLAVERDGGRIKSLKLLPVDDVREAQQAKRRLFDERMNTAGKLVDFGKVRTDGSFKLYKRQGALTLLPYPRDREFAIELDIATLAPGRSVAKVEALDVEGKLLGEVPHEMRRDLLSFRAGVPGAARFEVRLR
ncbi:MAG TPA: DUF5696 domain-containing protein [Planctomycetota bacterium]|nr:DUF5696 domain-containing protein [Planctomycetota bacterium]